MKNIIVTIAEILLGVFIFVLIWSDSNSLKNRAQDIFTKAATEINTITTVSP